MTTQATVIRVMIASPGDVSTERKLIQEVIHEWNAINALDRGIVLLPVGWETHSAPETGDRAQAIITKQILRDCDLLVGVFWTRLGSPTGVSASGTVEEIDEHIASNKPAMIYFSSVPVQQGSVNPNDYAELISFKTEYLKKALIEEYESLSDFRLRFSRQLAHTIIRKFNVEDLLSSPTLAEPARPSSINLSENAEILLQHAADSNSGSILMVDTLGGTMIETDGTSFAEEGDARSAAKWRSAVLELRTERLIEDITGKNEVFNITNRGYDIANMLGPYKPPDSD